MLRYIIGLAKKSPRFLLVLILTFDLDILSSTAIDILSGAMQIIFDQDIHLLIIYYIWPTRTLLVFKKFSPQNFPNQNWHMWWFTLSSHCTCLFSDFALRFYLYDSNIAECGENISFLPFLILYNKFIDISRYFSVMRQNFRICI